MKSRLLTRSRQVLLEDMPASLPALKTAQAIQVKVAEQGFDWPDITPVFDKLREEVDELEQAWRSNDIAAVRDETGDLLFSCVNLARHLGVDAEQSLSGCNHKFKRRFSYIESHLKAQGKKTAGLLTVRTPMPFGTTPNHQGCSACNNDAI